MKKIALLTTLVFMFAASLALAAGNAHIANNVKNGPSRDIIWDWTSDASGNVNTSGYVHIGGGTIFSALLVPEADVTDALDITISAVFTITLENGTSRTVTIADVLAGAGANLSNSTNGTPLYLPTQYTLPYWTRLELKIAGAGAAKQGTFVLSVWEERP